MKLLYEKVKLNQFIANSQITENKKCFYLLSDLVKNVQKSNDT